MGELYIGNQTQRILGIVDVSIGHAAVDRKGDLAPAFLVANGSMGGCAEG